ncbi:Nn.00g059090.m01.CDS01 [Neocucurbitaria sp. VM-36]
MAMDPHGRKVHTIGGRYRNVDAVEGAPFGELIYVRSTGLRFNVVHPIPLRYLAELDIEELRAVHAQITRQLSTGGYVDPLFVAAANNSLATVVQVLHENDYYDGTETATTNPSTNATYGTAPEQPQTPRTSLGIQDTLNWRERVPVGRAHSESSGFQEDYVTPMPSPSRTYEHQVKFEMDPAQTDGRARYIAESGTAEHELRDQESMLNHLESQSASCTDSALRCELDYNIRLARLDIREARMEASVSQDALWKVCLQTKKTMDLAEDWSRKNGNRNRSLSPTASIATPVLEVLPTLPPKIWPTAAPQQPRQISSPLEIPPIATPQKPGRTSSPTHAPEDSTDQIFDQLRDLDTSLKSLADSLSYMITRWSLRERVSNSLNKARDCINPARRDGLRDAQLDPGAVRVVGQAVLKAARLEGEKAECVLCETLEEEDNLNQVDRASDEAANRVVRAREQEQQRHAREQAQQAQQQARQSEERAGQRSADHRSEPLLGTFLRGQAQAYNIFPLPPLYEHPPPYIPQTHRRVPPFTVPFIPFPSYQGGQSNHRALPLRIYRDRDTGLRYVVNRHGQRRWLEGFPRF